MPIDTIAQELRALATKLLHSVDFFHFHTTSSIVKFRTIPFLCAPLSCPFLLLLDFTLCHVTCFPRTKQTKCILIYVSRSRQKLVRASTWIEPFIYKLKMQMKLKCERAAILNIHRMVFDMRTFPSLNLHKNSNELHAKHWFPIRFQHFTMGNL